MPDTGPLRTSPGGEDSNTPTLDGSPARPGSAGRDTAGGRAVFIAVVLLALLHEPKPHYSPVKLVLVGSFRPVLAIRTGTCATFCCEICRGAFTRAGFSVIRVPLGLRRLDLVL